MEKERSCEGYKIIDSIRVGDAEVVLGHSLTAPQPYVTWKTFEHSGYKDFVMGNYFNTLKGARIDFYDRVKGAWEHYTPAKRQTQDTPNKDTPYKRR